MQPRPRLVLLGKQGAGKGTQAVRISEHYDIAHLSTGDLFRDMARLGTEFGLKSKDFALRFIHEERVAAVPGTAFGECGEGFIRCAYATNMDNIKEAMVRLKRFIGKL